MRSRLTVVPIAAACLAAAACDTATFRPPAIPKSPRPEAATAAPAPVDVGPPLFPPADPVPVENPAPQPDPIVIHPAVVQFDMKVAVPAQVDGLIELVATSYNGPADPSDPNIVKHPRDGKMLYRKLRENDLVVERQLLVRLDEQEMIIKKDVSERMIEHSARAIEQSNIALREYQEKLRRLEASALRGAVPPLEVAETRATVARLFEQVIGSEKEKAKAEGDLIEANHMLTRYYSRSPFNGRVVKILKNPGEYAKAGDAILELQSTDRVRVEGKLDAQYAPLVKKDMPAVVEPMVPVGPAPYNNWHRQEVTGVAVTAHPGRPLIVSAGADAMALVWDVTKTKASFRLPHPAGVAVRSVACGASADGKQWAVTGADDGKLRLWDLSDPDRLPADPAEFDAAHPAGVTAVALSPDARFVASAAGRDVWVWDAAGKKKRYELPAGHRDMVTAVAFTPQCRLLTAARDRAVRVWELGDKGAKQVDPMLDHRSGAVDVLGVSADGSRVLFDKDAGRLDILSLADGRTVGTVQNPGGGRFAGLAVFGPGGKSILTAGGDADARGELQLWEAPPAGGRAPERRRLVTPGRAAVTAAAFSPDKDFPLVAVGTQYGGVHYWERPADGGRGKVWVGRVESVMPADARSVQVRVVMDNPADADALQDRSTATVILNPTGGSPLPLSAAPPALPAPNRLAPGGAVVPAAAELPAAK